MHSRTLILIALLLKTGQATTTSNSNPTKFISYAPNDKNTDDFRLVLDKWAPHYFSALSQQIIPPPTDYDATGVEQLHHLSKLHGNNIKIGMINSGIDYRHEAFAQHFAVNPPGFKYDTDFVSDDYDGSHPAKPSGQLPNDCNGSGTKLAGVIISQTPTFSGIAPGASLSTYRVIGCKGRTESKVILQALRMATEHNMDIIVLPTMFSDRQTAAGLMSALDDAARKNIVVIAPAGNSKILNASPKELVSLAGHTLITVGAADIPYYLAHWFWVKRTRVLFRYGCQNMNAVLGKVHVELGKVVKKDSSCELRGNFANKVVLINADLCPRLTMVDQARRGGAIGVILVMDERRQVTPERACILPTFIVSQEDAAVMTRYIWEKTPFLFAGESGKVTELENVRVDRRIAQLSRDKTRLDTDVVAPAFHLFTTLPSKGPAPYTYYSGPAAAAAYVAGAAALIIQSHGRKVSGAKMRSLLQNTAQPIMSTADGLLESAFQQGAGLLNAYNAAYPETLAYITMLAPTAVAVAVNTPGALPFRVVNIFNNSPETRTYHISARSAATIRADSDRATNADAARYRHHVAAVGFGTDSITIASNSQASVLVSLIEPDGLPTSESWLYSGYIVVDPYADGTKVPSAKAVHIPYFGVKKAQPAL